MNASGCLLVSWDFSHGKDASVVLVGEKKPGKDVEIINTIQGAEAEELYKRLVTRGRHFDRKDK